MHVLIVGGTASDRTRACAQRTSRAAHVVALDAATLPFTRVDDVALPPSPRVIAIEAIERGFPDNQVGSTRLVLTQSTYLMQKWIDALEPGDRIIATAEREALERCAPEALSGRGPWRRFEVYSCSAKPSGERPPDARLKPSRYDVTASPQPPAPIAEPLARAFATADAAERLRLCRDVAERAPYAATAHLALASAYREHRDLRARDALDRAATLAGDWEAVHFELGKLWLALDDLTRAGDSFRRAADLMPAFSAAWSNLGATLGELGDPDAALGAFRQALTHDLRSHTLLSNIGVVSRELGRFEESASALREAIAIAPEFVFGHYNLGHTLFLAGRYDDAVAAYEQGVRRDPQQTPVQVCRLAMARFAAGDVAGAERDLWPAVLRAPADAREDLLLEAYEIALAVGAARSEEPDQRAFADRLAAEIVKSG